ncbi:hypothetical protein JCGZ_05944 [Jatropha curcas]|uniref:Uncharacterized protein n=1 Tax=Jatropha curcas TaxID=180498 RepID=A0A067KZ14_JATCU|nr:hypothetical protein JCGZ_05944 [Jatropha curcas]
MTASPLPSPRFWPPLDRNGVAIGSSDVGGHDSSLPSRRSDMQRCGWSCLPHDSLSSSSMAIHAVSGGPSGGDRRQTTLHDAVIEWCDRCEFLGYLTFSATMHDGGGGGLARLRRDSGEDSERQNDLLFARITKIKSNF